MTDNPVNFEGLFTYARQHFDDLIAELSAYGIAPKSGIGLERTDGPYSFYDKESGQIYVSLPDFATPMGFMQKLFLRSLLGCEDDTELLTILRLWIPCLIAHEMGHHLRDTYGQMTTDRWHEEQVANQLAAAVIKRRLAPDEKAQAQNLLQRAIAKLAPRIEAKDVAADSFYNILDVLETDKKLGKVPVDNVEIIQRAFSIAPEEILKNSGDLSDDVLKVLDRRKDVIESFNDEYAANAIRYVYYHLGWLYYELASRETHYIEEFARLNLGVNLDLLPLVASDDLPGEAQILACYRAYQQLAPQSEVASRYFYKRYRSLLLALLRSTEKDDSATETAPARRMRQEALLLLENWQEEGADTLIFAEQLVPPQVARLLPHRIAAILAEADSPENRQLYADLPAETDQQLWQHVYEGQEDSAAANTLRRLALLDQSSILRSLPSEVALELAQRMTRIILQEGETLIWQGESGNDIFILAEGELEVVMLPTRRKALKQIAELKPGDVVGEIAFFTREARNATVRARTQAECYVLKASDFYLIGLSYPAVFLHMARSVASRLLTIVSAASESANARGSRMQTILGKLMDADEGAAKT